jgi:two-component sensor histidine kinase
MNSMAGELGIMTDEPEIEPAPADKADRTEHALKLRIRQQEILAQLGVLALQGTPFPELIEQTVGLTAEGMRAEFCKVLEYLPAENRFLVRAGVGWHPGVVGSAKIGADLASPAGFALRTGKPVISNSLDVESRFETPALLLEHGVRRAINVILQGDRDPYGVLEIDSRSPGEFAEHDLAFLQGAANILGMAIERQRFERELNAALAHREVLLREVDHRVKNSLQLVMSILRLQGDAAEEPAVQQQLREAAARISAIARVHQRLHQSSQVETIDLGAYLKDLCRDFSDMAPTCEIQADVTEGIEVPTARAVSIALLVNELMVNAATHAYPGKTICRIWVKLERTAEGKAVVSVRDAGAGLPADYDPVAGKGLGMRIVHALGNQLDADVRVHPRHPGTEIVVTMDVKRPGR